MFFILLVFWKYAHRDKQLRATMHLTFQIYLEQSLKQRFTQHRVGLFISTFVRPLSRTAHAGFLTRYEDKRAEEPT